MDERICTIEGCERSNFARGWCSRHWRRWRAYGDPTLIVGTGNVSPLLASNRCSTPGCDRPTRTRSGLCRGHSQTMARYGTVDGDAILRLRFPEHYRIAESGCWLWTGGNNGIYGMLIEVRNGKRIYHGAHRLSWELHRGPIPDGLHVDHHCRVPLCVNPDHLEPVTREENIRRAVEARRAARTA